MAYRLLKNMLRMPSSLIESGPSRIHAPLPPPPPPLLLLMLGLDRCIPFIDRFSAGEDMFETDPV